MTSFTLAEMVLEENRPFDYNWLRYVKRTEGFNGLLKIAKNTTECFASKGCSKRLIGRAAKIVAETLYNEIW